MLLQIATESRKSQKPAVKKLDVSMISGPGNDLRHTGHIGYDGAVFGDVSFIGDNYSRLPMKIVSGTCTYCRMCYIYGNMSELFVFGKFLGVYPAL